MSTGEPHQFHACPCCEANVLTARGQYEICPICNWEDDPVQSADPEHAGGANKLSLRQAREAWQSRSLIHTTSNTQSPPGADTIWTHSLLVPEAFISPATRPNRRLIRRIVQMGSDPGELTLRDVTLFDGPILLSDDAAATLGYYDHLNNKHTVLAVHLYLLVEEITEVFPREQQVAWWQKHTQHDWVIFALLAAPDLGPPFSEPGHYVHQELNRLLFERLLAIRPACAAMDDRFWPGVRVSGWLDWGWRLVMLCEALTGEKLQPTELAQMTSHDAAQMMAAKVGLR